MALWNKRRDAEYGTADVLAGDGAEDALAQLDETDWKNKSIRYSL